MSDMTMPDQDLAQKIESLERQCQALSQSLAHGRNVRLALTLAVLLGMFIGGMAFYRLGVQVKSQPNVDRVVQLAQQRLEQRSDHMMKEVQLLVDHTTPVLTQAFYQQAKKDLPKFLSSIDQQRDEFVVDLERDLRTRFEEHHQASVARFEQILAKEFPATQDKELHGKMMENVGLAMSRLEEKYYFERFRHRLNDLYDTLDRFPMAAAPQQGDAPLEDQLVVSIVDLMMAKIAENNPPQVAQIGRAD